MLRRAALTVLLVGCLGHTAMALPGEVKAEYTVGGGPLAAAFGGDDRLGVVVNGDDGTLSLIDTADLASSPSSVSTCDAPRAVRYAEDSEAFVIACEDGMIARSTVSFASFPATLSSLTDVVLSDGSDLVDVGVSGSDAFPVSDDGWLYHVDLSTSSEDTDSYYPIDLADEGSGDDDDSADVERVEPVAVAVDADGAFVVVALADGTLVDVEIGDEGYSVTHVDTGEAGLLGLVGKGPFYLLSEDGDVLSYEAGSYAPAALAVVSGGEGMTMMQDGGEDVLAIAGGYDLSYIDPATGEELGTVALSATADILAATSDGYLVAVDTDSSQLQLLTSNPWVRVLGIVPDPIDTEGDATLSISADADGSLSVLLGGNIDASGTDLQPDIEAISADIDTDVVVSATSLTDGAVVYVFVEDADGATGRVAVQVSVATPVDVPAPAGFAATAGDAQVTLTWVEVEPTGTTVDHYVVYFADATFEPADGDPGYCTEDGTLCSPEEVYVAASTWSPIAEYTDDDTGDDDTADDDTADDDTADDDTAGDDDTAVDDGTVSVTVYPLTNGTVYYFAVAAVASTGETGEFSSLVSAMPQETGGAAWLAGDAGGYGCDGCSTIGAPTGEFVTLALLAMLVAVRRVKR